MARLKKAILGKISGAVGDILFRIRRNRNYVGTRPSSFIPGTDVNSVNRRRKFRITVKFASAVNKISFLRTLWDKHFPEAFLPLNSIYKTNYPNTVAEDLTNFVQLVPDLGFEIPGHSATFSSDEIEVQLDPIGSGTSIDPAVETDFALCGVIYLTGKLNENYRTMPSFLSCSLKSLSTLLILLLSPALFLMWKHS